jgi:hypothetical protein
MSFVNLLWVVTHRLKIAVLNYSPTTPSLHCLSDRYFAISLSACSVLCESKLLDLLENSWILSRWCVCVRACMHACARCDKAVLLIRNVLKCVGHGAGPTFVLGTIATIFQIRGKNTVKF